MMVDIKHGRSSSPVGWRMASKKNTIRCLLLSVALTLAFSTLVSLSSGPSASSSSLMVALDDNVHRRPFQQQEQEEISHSQEETPSEYSIVLDTQQQTQAASPAQNQPPLVKRRDKQLEIQLPTTPAPAQGNVEQLQPSPPPKKAVGQTSPPINQVVDVRSISSEEPQNQTKAPNMQKMEQPSPSPVVVESKTKTMALTANITKNMTESPIPATTPTKEESQSPSTRGTIRITHIGNSIQFYNFFPTFFRSMLETAGWNVVPGDKACLVGATNFAMLANRNCPRKLDMGMHTGHLLTHDVVILNDRSFEPAFWENRDNSTHILTTKFAPWFLEHNVTPIFLQTAAWRKMLLPELHSFKMFTKWVRKGYHQYVRRVNEVFLQQQRNDSNATMKSAQLAPVGDAFAMLHDSNNNTWYRLYQGDHRHPSQFGALLQAYVLMCTMFPDEVPPTYETTWWNDQAWRRHKNKRELLPTREEARELWETALSVCNMTVPSTNTTALNARSEF